MTREVTCYDFALKKPKLTIRQLDKIYKARQIMLKRMGIQYK